MDELLISYTSILTVFSCLGLGETVQLHCGQIGHLRRPQHILGLALGPPQHGQSLCGLQCGHGRHLSVAAGGHGLHLHLSGGGEQGMPLAHG